MENLPAEVYLGIFYHLNRPDLLTCYFVCKRWNLLAVQVYSKELIIDCHKTELAKVYLASNHANAFFKNGNLARKLTFKTGFERQVELCRGRIWPINENRQRKFCFNQAEFLSLLDYFPNIEDIDLTESEDFAYYISFLFFANLQHVKKITAFQFKSRNKVSVDYQEYFATCFRFCGTLTHIYFEYTKYTKYYSCDGVGILDMLSQFKSLKHLEFYNAYSDSMIMFQILELCPQLTELTFTTDFSDYEVCVQESSYQIIEPDVKLNKKLLRLNINLLSLSTDYTQYLTSYITDGLHTLNIRITSTGLYNCVEKVGVECFLKLIRKLGQLNDACISFSQNSSSRSARLTNELKSARWLQVADAFKGDKNILCTVKFRKSSLSQDYFKYNASKKRLVFAYVLEDVTSHEFGNIVYDGEDVDYEELEDVYYDEREAAYYPGRDTGYPIYRSDGPLSESTVIINSISAIGPETIDRLEIDTGKVSDDFVMKLLKYVFINCKNLRYLKVSDYFQIQSCLNQRNEELNDIKDNLKMVHFLSSAPNNKIFNIILEYIPDIEVLALGSHSRFNSNFDLTLFKSLKRCYIIIPKVSDYNYEALNIKFEYTDGKKQQYYYDGTAKNTLVREDISRIIRLCRSLTFICKKSVEFIVCFGSNKSLLDFNIDKPQESRFRVPTYPLTIN